MAETLLQVRLFGLPDEEITVLRRDGLLLSAVEDSGYREYQCRRCRFLWEFYDTTRPQDRQPCPACEQDVNEDRPRQRPAPTTTRERYQRAHAAARRYGLHEVATDYAAVVVRRCGVSRGP